jgi:hypothetical protein
MPPADFRFFAGASSGKMSAECNRRLSGATSEDHMKFQVVGQNRDTGARMSLEFEAESKAAAERKANQAGMSVHHVTDVTDGHAGGTGVNPAYRGPVRTGSGTLMKLLVLVVIVVAAWYLWTHRHTLLHR